MKTKRTALLVLSTIIAISISAQGKFLKTRNNNPVVVTTNYSSHDGYRTLTQLNQHKSNLISIFSVNKSENNYRINRVEKKLTKLNQQIGETLRYSPSTPCNTAQLMNLSELDLINEKIANSIKFAPSTSL